MTKYSGESVFVPGGTVAHRMIGGEAVLVDIHVNVMIRLNSTGSRIWSLLDGNTADEIVEKLVTEFQVRPKDAMADVSEFLETLHTRGYIVESDK